MPRAHTSCPFPRTPQGSSLPFRRQTWPAEPPHAHLTRLANIGKTALAQPGKAFGLEPQGLGTRRPAGVHLSGLWEFPGGKLGPDETAEVCAERELYEKYFDARSSSKYENERKRFSSYFLTLPGGGRLELMHRPDIQRLSDSPRSHEFGPRRTGDGYDENMVADPECNRIVIAE